MADVLLAHDLSSATGPVAETAHELASRFDLDLLVVHVVSDRDLEDLRRDRPEQDAYLDVVLDEVRSRIRDEIQSRWGGDAVARTEVRVLHGEPAATVVKQVSEGDHRFVVIGVRNRSRVGKLVFGSTAQSILLQSPCPVVAVPTEG